MPDILATEAAWMAGLMDGEGSFYISRGRQKHRWIYRPEVRVDLTTPSAIDVINDLCVKAQLSAHRYFQSPKNVKHRDKHILSITRYRDVVTFVDIVIPYLVIKRAAAQVLREFCTRRLQCDHRNSNAKQHGRFTATYDGTEEQYFTQLKSINKRGR